MRRDRSQPRRGLHVGAQLARGGPATAPAAGTNAAIAQLRQLDELPDEGILTDGEFEARKAKILAR